MAVDPDIRRQLQQQARLWTLSLVCATAGAVVVWRTSEIVPGVVAFMVALVFLGPPLWTYERRKGGARQR